MTAIELLTELRNAGIRVEPRPTGNLYLAPKDRLTPTLVEQVRAHKAALLALLTRPEPRAVTPDSRQPAPGVKQDNPIDPAEKALELLARLKGYTLPSGRIPVARELAERMAGLTEPPDILARPGALQVRGRGPRRQA